jgi:flagellar FliL protein
VFKNKLLQLGVIILIALALIAVVVVILFNTILDTSPDPNDPNASVKEKVEDVDSKKYSADELLEMSVHMNDLLGNLSNNDIVQLSLTFELDSVEAKEEFEKLDYITKDVVLKTIADMKPEDIKGAKGIDFLSATLMNKVNPKLSEGKLREIYVTKLILP